MSLLPVLNACRTQGQANPEYYFALSGGSVGPVRDSAFVATGLGSPPNGGSFTAISEDTTGQGTDAFIMTDISGVARWAIGTNGVEAGANSGDNFAIYAYDDNGAFLTAPLTINRASGGVAMPNGLTVGNTLISTGPIVGPDGPVLAKQTDFVQNQFIALPAVLPAGRTTYNIGAAFQLATTGLYLINGFLGFNAASNIDTFVCAPGDYVSVFVRQQPPAPGALNGGVDFDVSPVPAIPVGSQVDRAWYGAASDKLNGGVTYQVTAVINNFSGTMAATGGAGLAVGFDIAALC